jgi:hypothetical protein
MKNNDPPKHEYEIILSGANEEIERLIKIKHRHLITLYIVGALFVTYSLLYSFGGMDPVNYISKPHAAWMIMLFLGAICYISARTEKNSIEILKKLKERPNQSVK